LDKVLRAFGFNKKELYADACLYKMVENGALILVLVWVDDCFTAWKGLDLYNRFKVHCGKSFTMKDLGPVSFALGMRV
jgi:hypothetical protein